MRSHHTSPQTQHALRSPLYTSLHTALLAATLACAAPLGAQTLLTSGFVGTQATSFSSACTAAMCTGQGPFNVGANGFDVTLSGNHPAVVFGSPFYGMGANGFWNGVSMAGANGVTESAYIDFATAVTMVGGFMNYSPTQGPATLVAWNGTTQLGSWVLDALAPISTPGATNGGAFRGVEYAGGITRLELRGAYLSTQDLLAAGVVRVPEPHTAVLLLLGVSALLIVGRKARRTR